MQTVKENELFHPISLSSLRVDTVTDFDIYLRAPRAEGEQFTLYRGKNIVFTERVLHNLLEHGTERLFIRVQEKREYHRYLERNLQNILHDDKVCLKEKSKTAYACAGGLVEELLENPRSGQHIHRSRKLISHLADYLLSGSQVFFSLIAATSFDYYTYTHSVNVAVFGMALAHKVGAFTLHQINTIGLGLIVHDIGKSTIDQSILNKKGPLNSGEWEIIRQHPENGLRLLKGIGQLPEEALAIVWAHHEKLDGSGYPRALRGEAVHLYARIAALADIFDALTTSRSYKSAEKTFPALQIMRDEMTGQIDSDLFREFVLLFRPIEATRDCENKSPASLESL